MGSISGTLYIGMSGNLPKRVFEHKFHRIEGFTDESDIERLLYWESYDDVHKAIGREKQLKGWRREKKVVLIESPTRGGSIQSKTGTHGWSGVKRVGVLRLLT